MVKSCQPAKLKQRLPEKNCLTMFNLMVVRYRFFLDHTKHFQLTFYQPSLDLIDVKISPGFGKELTFG